MGGSGVRSMSILAGAMPAYMNDSVTRKRNRFVSGLTVPPASSGCAAKYSPSSCMTAKSSEVFSLNLIRLALCFLVAMCVSIVDLMFGSWHRHPPQKSRPHESRND